MKVNLHFTLYPAPAQTSVVGVHREIEWADLVSFVSKPKTVTKKEDLEGWSPVLFKGNQRGGDNVMAISAVGLDDDDSGKTTDELAEVWAPFAGVIHTTASHMQEKHGVVLPRHRVILRTSRDMSAAEQPIVWRLLHDYAASRGQELDPSPKDASRFWYAPGHVHDAPYAWHELTGAPLNIDAMLATAPAEMPVPSARIEVSAKPADASKAARILAAAWPAKGQRDRAKMALAGACYHDGKTEAEALSFLRSVYAHVDSEDGGKLETKVSVTYKRAAEGKQITGWTTLETLLGVDVRKILSGEAALAARFMPDPNKDTSINSFGIIWGGWDEPVIVPPYLLEGLIPSEKVCTFFAEGGSIKSWVAFELAISVATGRPWLGSFNVNAGKPGKALILDFEDGREEFKRRKQILVRGGNDPLPLLGYKYSNTDVLDPQVWLDLATLDLTLLVVDSLGAAMPGDADENATTFAAAVKHAGKFTTYTKTTVIFVAHANKTGGLRGTGAIRDQSDCAFTFVPISETENGEEKRMRLVCDKPGPQKKPKPVNIMLSDRGLVSFKEEELPEPPAEDRARAQILSMLKTKPAGMNKTVLLDAIKINAAVKKQVLAQLVAIEVVNEIRFSKEVIVKLADASRQNP
jgi:AAA domain